MPKPLAITLMCAVLLTPVVVGVVAQPVKDAPLFQVGETYGVIWSCLPIPSPHPCYGEALTVVRVRADGWVEMRDDADQPWTVNPANILSYQHLTPAAKASR